MTGLDYADWLTPQRLEIEEAQWAEHKLYVRYAGAVRRMVQDYPMIKNVVEFGAGTGWVPTQLDDLKLDRYVCVDRNPGCIAKAHERLESRKSWVQIWSMEVRDLWPIADLVCSFAVLKHFRLDEWKTLFVQLYHAAPYGLFSVPLAREMVDDGLEYTHVLITEEFLADAVRASGHRILWRDETSLKEPIFAIGPLP